MRDRGQSIRRGHPVCNLDAAFDLCERAQAVELESIQDKTSLWRRYAWFLERKVLLAKHRLMRRRRADSRNACASNPKKIRN